MTHFQTAPSVADALSSGLGGLGLSTDMELCAPWTQVDTPWGCATSYDRKPTQERSQDNDAASVEEPLSPRVQHLSVEIAKLRHQIKLLTRRRKLLDARKTKKPEKTQDKRSGDASMGNALDCFPTDERRRRMLSAKPPKRTATLKASRGSGKERTCSGFTKTNKTSKTSHNHSEQRVRWGCGVEVAAIDADQKSDNRLSVSFLLS